MSDKSLIVVPGPAALPAQVVEDTITLAHIASIADRAAAASELARYQEGCSSETLRRQRADLDLFASYLAETGVQVSGDVLYSDCAAWSGVSHGIVQGFIAWSLAQGYATGSVNVRLATVKRYCELASRSGAIEPDALSLIKTVRGYRASQARNVDEKRAQSGTRTRREGAKKSEPTFLADVHVRMLKDELFKHLGTHKGQRDALIFCLLLDMGLRVGEIAALNRSSIDLAAGRITVYRHKVNRTETHDMSPDTYRIARAYLGLFSELSEDQEHTPLFTSTLPTAKKTRIDTRTISERVKTLSTRIIGIDLSPHDGRHTWADGAVRAGTDLKSLRDAGGWSSLAMPERYVKRNTIANQGLKLPWSSTAEKQK